MAIKGLTDRLAAFPIIGILRKGEKKEKENAPGRDLTYFRFVTDDALAEKMFTEAYPDENSLRTVNVFLPYPTTDENMDAWIEKWVAGGLIYRSDGESVVLWRTDKGGYSTQAKPDPQPEIKEDGKRADGSMQVGRLSVIIPELGRFATVTILTTSKHDIINLTRQLRSYEALRGNLRGIPFVLKRRPHKISTPAGKGKRARREKWLLSIETQPQWTMAQLSAMERAALPEGEIIDLETTEFEVSDLPVGITDPLNGDVESIEVKAEPQPETPTPKAKQEQPATANGNGRIPNSPQGIMDAVNAKLGQLYYKALPHIFNTLKQELGSNWSYPLPKDSKGWKIAYDTLLFHAQSKLEPAQEPAADSTEKGAENADLEPVMEEGDVIAF